jgi:general secretion pathway protein F
MPTFQYSAGSKGATIDAPDRASAVRELLRRGVTPTSVEPFQGGAPAHADGPAGAITFKRVMSRAEVASFVRELATAIQAGLPLVTALRTIARQGRNATQQRMVNHLISEVEQGHSLADAAESWGRPFGDLLVSLIRAGETSGRLPEVLLQAANLLDRDVALRRAILAATLYPMILGFLIVCAIIVVTVKIVPDILSQVNIPPDELPMPTRIVRGFAMFISGWWWVIVPAILAIVLGAARAYAQPGPRLKVDRTLLGVPVLGRLLRDVAVARFTRTLGTLTNAGIPILTSLQVTKRTLNNRAMEQVVDEVCDQVASGKTIADPMERSGYFPPMLVQIVNLGERSGRLDEMLHQSADAFESRTEMSVKLLTTALPPVLVVIMACAVGFIVLSILLPLLQMQEAIA